MCTQRKCTSCKIEKPITREYFYNDKNRPLGLSYRCIECDRERKDKRTRRYSSLSQEQKDRHYDLGVKYRATPKGKAIGLLNAYKKEDKRKNREFNLIQDDILEVHKKDCIYCGFPATGFDRINNNLGHTKNNCVPCCKECNVARMNNFTHQETFLLGKTIREIKLLRDRL